MVDSGQDCDPSSETVVAPLSTEWGEDIVPDGETFEKTPLSTKGNTILGIATPQEHGAEHIGCLVTRPMLTQDIGRIFGPGDVPEVKDLSSDSFANSIAGERGPSLIELGVRDSAAGDDLSPNMSQSHIWSPLG